MSALRPRVAWPVALLAVPVILLLMFSGCIRDTASKEEKDRATAAALQVYAEKKAEGVDFTDGPCIAEEVIDDWSVDIAHDPRQAIDEDSDNQCRYYRDGKTHHFVELTPDGEVIRVR